MLLITLCRTGTKADPQCLVTIPIRAQECHQQRVASIHWRYVNIHSVFKNVLHWSLCPRVHCSGPSPTPSPSTAAAGSCWQPGPPRPRRSAGCSTSGGYLSLLFFVAKVWPALHGYQLCNVRYPEQCLCVWRSEIAEYLITSSDQTNINLDNSRRPELDSAAADWQHFS